MARGFPSISTTGTRSGRTANRSCARSSGRSPAYRDILVGNEEDFQLCLGIQGPEAGGENLAAKIDSFKGMIHRTQQAFPHVSVFATTLREVFHANCHNWGAILSVGSQVACRTAA